MRTQSLVASLGLILVTGCAWLKTPATAPSTPASQPSPAASTPTPPPSGAPPTATTITPVPQDNPTAAKPRPAPARPAKPVASAAAKPSPAPAAAPVKTPAQTGPAAASPTAASLDLTSLEERLKDTKAIGVFTKLSLKNQVDDLLNDFRTFYKGPNKKPGPELRQRYDLLLMKVLSLLQDGDPPLAAAISSSKEAIWNILADPDKLAKI